MVANANASETGSEDEKPKNSLQSSPLASEIHGALADLRGEVAALRKEVNALRRKETPDGPDALLSREEAAEQLGISVRTLDDMADAGEIQPVRIRGRVLYSPSNLEAHVRQQAGGDQNG